MNLSQKERTKLSAIMLILVITLQSFVSANSDFNDQLRTNNLQNHHWHHGMNAGMGFNLNGDDISIFRKYSRFFLPGVASHVFGSRPEFYIITFSDPFGDPFGIGQEMESSIEWTNIQYVVTDVEYDKVTFSLDEWEGHGLFYFDFPAFRDFEFKAHQTFEAWWFPEWLLNKDTEVILKIINFNIDFRGQFELDQNGYLDPIVYGVDIDFGDSNFEQDDAFLEFVTFEIIQFSMVVIHNTAWILGKYMFTNMLGPVMDKYLNHYQAKILARSPILGQDTNQYFTVDYRNTQDPLHLSGTNSIMFMLSGEFFLDDQGCSEYNPVDFKRLAIAESYLVMSPQSLECMLEQYGKSNLGKFGLNQKNLEAMLNDKQPHPVTSSTLEMQLFRDKVGANKPLNIIIGYRDLKLKLVNSEHFDKSNIEMKMTITMQTFYDFEDPEHMHMNLPKDELFYDEIPFIFDIHLQDYNDIMFPKINKWGIDLAHGTKHYPHRNSMDMQPADYILFLEQFTRELDKDKTLLNFKFNEGFKYPYSVPEFNTSLWIDTNAMYFVFTQRKYTAQEIRDFYKLEV